MFWILVLEKKMHKKTIHNYIIISITKSAFKPSTCVLVNVCTSKVYVICKGTTDKVMVKICFSENCQRENNFNMNNRDFLL